MALFGGEPKYRVFKVAKRKMIPDVCGRNALTAGRSFIIRNCRKISRSVHIAIFILR